VADSANAVAVTNIVGVLLPAQLPSAMITNNSVGVNLNGAFSGSFGGDGSAMTNLNATQLGGVVPHSALPSDLFTNGQSTSMGFNGLGNGWFHALELTNNACLWLDTGGFAQTADPDVQTIPDALLNMYAMGMDVPFGEVIYGSGRNEWQALEVFMSCPGGTSTDSNWPEGCKSFSLSCAGQIRLWNRLDTLDNAGMIVLGQQDPAAYSNYFGIGVSQRNLLCGMTQSNGTFVTTNILIDPSGRLSLYSPNTGYMTVNANVEINGSIRVNGTIDATGFNTTGDQDKKEGFVPVDPRSVLDRVVALPISQWNFKSDARTRHIGPMAQDFWGLFGLGSDEKHIATVDEEGVALGAIQGLNQRIDEQARQISNQGTQIKTLQQTIAELQEAVSELKRKSAASGVGDPSR
jgi:hypothetical protein